VDFPLPGNSPYSKKAALASVQGFPALGRFVSRLAQTPAEAPVHPETESLP
jgi:hypothetical protein